MCKSADFTVLQNISNDHFTGGNPDRFVGKIPTSYKAKQKSIGFSDTLALNSHTTFPVRSVGISSRLNAPLLIDRFLNFVFLNVDVSGKESRKC